MVRYKHWTEMSKSSGQCPKKNSERPSELLFKNTLKDYVFPERLAAEKQYRKKWGLTQDFCTILYTTLKIYGLILSPMWQQNMDTWLYVMSFEITGLQINIYMDQRFSQHIPWILNWILIWGVLRVCVFGSLLCSLSPFWVFIMW